LDLETGWFKQIGRNKKNLGLRKGFGEKLVWIKTYCRQQVATLGGSLNGRRKVLFDKGLLEPF